MGLKVVDLYCGAGGFSEGFRQLGFDIVLGIDNWDEARTTFRENIPEAFVPEEHFDIPASRKEIAALVKERFGGIDVVIGGPPCVEFSSSRGHNRGNTKKGLRHVGAFYNIVGALKPTYWIMENVPRIREFLASSEEDGILEPPSGKREWIFDSQYHGVPQARKRLFTGRFPGEAVSDQENHTREWNPMSMRKVIDGLPDCSRSPSAGIVKDPLYPRLKIGERRLTNHFEYARFLRLSPWERRKSKDMKCHHPYYGRLSFPEILDRPSRTIMATTVSMSRESIVIKDNTAKRALRLPTPRESACLQGFPLNYHFWGRNVRSRTRLIGNAVPVGLARSLARAILIEEGLPVPEQPSVSRSGVETPTTLKLPEKKPHVLKGTFHWHPVKSMVAGCRVDLDNTQMYNPSGKPSMVAEGLRHECRWDAVLHIGIGAKRWEYELVEPTAVLESLRISDLDSKKRRLLLSSVRSLHAEVPDATALYHAQRYPSRRGWRKSVCGIVRPRALLEQVDKMRREVVRSQDQRVHCEEHISICPSKGIPLFTLVIAFILHWMCRETNDCTHWMVENQKTMAVGKGDKKRHKTGKRCAGVRSKDFPRSI